MVVTAGLMAWLSTPALAQDSGDTASLTEAIAQLRAEIAGLRADLATVKAELAKAQNQIKQLDAQVKGGAKAKPQQRERPAMELLGKDAPVKPATTHQGNELTIGGTHEKPQVVIFWASGGGFCRRALPGIEKVYEDYKEKGVDVIAVNMDARSGQRGKTLEESLKVYNDLKLTMPVVWDNERAIGTAYKATSFPTLFVLGPNGKVEGVHIGAKATLPEDVSKQLDLLLEGKEVPKE